MLTLHLEKLIHFVGVSRAGSIRKYSLAHGLSQPAVSTCIKKLETELESALFLRSQDGIRLTQAGETLLQWAEPMLAEGENVDHLIRTRGENALDGNLWLGTYQSIAVYFVPQLYQFLQHEQSRLRLQVLTSSSAELVAKLKANEVDFIISVDPPESRELCSSPLFEDRYSVYRKRNSKHSPKRAALFTLATAKDQRGKSLKQYLTEADLWERTVSCGDFEGAKALALADIGYALLPDRVAWPWVESRNLEKANGFPKMSGIGRHQVTFTCKKHRASDANLVWIEKKIRQLLSSKSRSGRGAVGREFSSDRLGA